MFISDFAIKRPIITVVAMLTLVVFGLFALFRLQTDEFPDVAPPFVTVAIPYPGASPDGVERELLDPIEEAISAISGVKKVNGTAQDGYATITRRRLPTGGWQNLRLTDYRTTSTDSHNVICIGIAPQDGSIHLAFDMHSSALRYRRSVTGLALRLSRYA